MTDEISPNGRADQPSGATLAPGRSQRPAPGLYLVSTPIGAARDITLRALDVLAQADVLAAEDTRTLRHLMEIHGIPLAGRRILSLHDHNAAHAIPGLLAGLREGKVVAYASEAGTPLISDPGFELVRAARQEGLAVFAAPGASAVLAALTVAGLPTDRFLFAGFPPSTSKARKSFLTELAPMRATQVLYEAPGRVRDTLTDLCESHGKSRRMALCRELTKRFEEVLTGTAEEILGQLSGRSLKGEFVLVIDRALPEPVGPETVEAALKAAMARMTLKDASAEVADMFGLPRRDIYQLALKVQT